MKPLEVWTCQSAENLKKNSSKIPKNNYAATMVSAARRQNILHPHPKKIYNPPPPHKKNNHGKNMGWAARQKICGGAPDKLSAAARRSTKVGGGAHKLSAAAAGAQRGRRTALVHGPRDMLYIKVMSK